MVHQSDRYSLYVVSYFAALFSRITQLFISLERKYFTEIG